MISQHRITRLNELDAILRSESGLNLREVAKRFGVTPITLRLDIDRLKISVGPIVSTGRWLTLTYRYASPIPSMKFPESVLTDDQERERAVRETGRRATLHSIRGEIEKLRKKDPEGPAWVLEQLNRD